MAGNWIIDALWLGFVAIWIVAATVSKPTASRPNRRHGVALRIAIVLLALLLSRLGFWRHLTFIWPNSLGGRSLAIKGAGIGLCASGLCLAVWARLYLGRNWGMPMTLREGHELVVGGPYAYARHPIYGGIILATFGSFVAVGALWLPLLALLCAYFLFSARAEEKHMSNLFPDAYPDYMRRTKMLIPFLI